MKITIVFDAAGMCYRALGDSVGQAWVEIINTFRL